MNSKATLYFQIKRPRRRKVKITIIKERKKKRDLTKGKSNIVIIF
jgi:hypothetical protein